MPKSKRQKPQQKIKPQQASNSVTQTSPGGSNHSARNVRETIESVVIAFVLAFLFRTFEAEAFVIPTGSMAPTLQGRHKDVNCPKCDFLYQASASVEAEDDIGQMEKELQQAEFDLAQTERSLRSAPAGRHQNQLLRQEYNLREESKNLRGMIAGRTVVSSTCPMCRYSMSADKKKSYNGDRILVNKFIYEFRDPQRWDVAVFKYPGDAKMNYIKRLVGLPNEIVMIQNGDILIKPKDAENFTIARKPPHKLRAMMQTVHDTRYFPRELLEKNWPLRWQVASTEADTTGGWTTRDEEDSLNIRQLFSIDSTDGPRWIRYNHLVPSWNDWEEMRRGPLPPDRVAEIRPQLITDFYAYNTSVTRGQRRGPDHLKLGLHWVGDLMVECHLDVKRPGGEFLLDLVEGGKHFGCRVDLKSGRATLSIQGVDSFSPSAQTKLRGPGRYRVAFANVDDQLLLWINHALVEFNSPSTYDADQVFGSRSQIQPESTPENPGDLAPVGVGAHGSALEIDYVQVLRDTYYIADDAGEPGRPITDYSTSDPLRLAISDFLSDPSRWDAFSRRQTKSFPLGEDQFFVLGDNSPFSKDGRLWRQDSFGHYVERQLLIGKALFIYWPHSWDRIPGTPIPFPLFPNFADMGLVR